MLFRLLQKTVCFAVVTIKEGPAFVAAAPVAGPFEPEGSNLGTWAIFFAGFAGGLLALLRPCVFPMLPFPTMSFIVRMGSIVSTITKREWPMQNR